MQRQFSVDLVYLTFQMAAKTRFLLWQEWSTTNTRYYGIEYGIEINRQKNSKLSVSSEKYIWPGTQEFYKLAYKLNLLQEENELCFSLSMC